MEVIFKFPHNCLKHKTTIQEIEASSSQFNDVNHDWRIFKGLANPGDEIWFWGGNHVVPTYFADQDRAVKHGYCLIRNNKVIAIYQCLTVSVT